eukprot:Trichotokara_eunicae@DN4587_c0_g2_i1.p1
MSGLPLILFGATAILTAYFAAVALPETIDRPLYDSLPALKAAYKAEGFPDPVPLCCPCGGKPYRKLEEEKLGLVEIEGASINQRHTEHSLSDDEGAS